MGALREVSLDGGTKGRTALAAAAVFLSVLLFVGCRSSAPAPASDPSSPAAQAREAAAPGDQAASEEAEAAERAPVEVTAVDVREGAPGSIIELTANEPLVWTSFRDTEGNVVVELPNTVAPDLGELDGEGGAIAALEVEEDRSGTRPKTRVVVTPRGETEANVRADGMRLLVEIVPTDAEAQPSLAFEPIAEEEALAEAPSEAPSERDEPAPVMEPAPAAPTAPEGGDEADAGMAERSMARELGTPEDPVEGPEPEGVQATRLRGVSVERTDDVTVVEISGDGQFDYSTFRLGEPERFVVDLLGVVNQADRASFPVGSQTVERIRVGQFKPFPEPVSRVVFDLAAEPRPEIERTPESLIVRFRTSGAPPERAERPAEPPMEAPAMAEEPSTEEPAMEEPAMEEPTMAEPTMAEDASMEAEPSMEPEPEPAETPAAGTPAGEPEPAARTEPGGAAEAVEEPADVEITNVPPPPPASRAEAPAETPSDAALFGADEVQIQTPRQQEPEAEDEEGIVFGARTVSGEREYTGAPIDMSLKDADVVETLRSFSKFTGLNIVIQPEVSGRVTVELENVPWDQALEQILKINGLGYEVEGNIMRIARLETLSREAEQQQRLEAAKALSRPLQTVMKRLSYTSANNVANILRGGRGGTILSQRGSVIVDGRTNTLIISELPEYMDTVLAIIDNLDEPEPQVMIEARIIETTKRFSRTLGVQWGFELEAGPATGNSTGLQFPNNLDAGGSVNLPTGGQNALLNISMGSILDTFRLDAALNAAEEDGLVNILSTPKVATLNNNQAVIQSGVQVPIQTVANNTVTVQFVNATLRLEVTPQITADGTVVMDIRIQKREVQTAFLLPGAQNAPIATKEAETQVLVRDGGTAVIGGIYEVSTDQSENRVPGLANIPILGHLFKNRDRSDENEELLIFITPRVVRL